MEFASSLKSSLGGFLTPKSQLLFHPDADPEDAEERPDISDPSLALTLDDSPLSVTDSDLVAMDIQPGDAALEIGTVSPVESDTDAPATGLSLDQLSDTAYELASEPGQPAAHETTTRVVVLSASDDRFITDAPEDMHISGSDGSDAIKTGGGNDVVSGDGGSDLINTGAGNDTILSGGGSDILTGGTGADVFAFHVDDFAEDGVTAKYITDFTAGVDKIELSGFGIASLSDVKFTSIGKGDVIDLGNSRFIVLEGLDIADLGDFDIVGADRRNPDFVADPMVHSLTDASDLFVSTGDQNATIHGYDGADTLVSGSGDDTVYGGAGGDKIIGGDGDDVIAGGAGLDILSGRAGADTFVFVAGEEAVGTDHITDFEVGNDKIELVGFGLGGTENLLWQSIPSGVALQIAPDRFVVFDGYPDAGILNDTESHWIFSAA